jgi:hypothetical protein
VDAVAVAKAALNIAYAPGDSAASVSQNVTLPANGVDGCSITWTSDTPATVATNGVVTQPPSDEVIVTLTATIHSHAVRAQAHPSRSFQFRFEFRRFHVAKRLRQQDSSARL